MYSNQGAVLMWKDANNLPEQQRGIPRASKCNYCISHVESLGHFLAQGSWMFRSGSFSQ